MRDLFQDLAAGAPFRQGDILKAIGGHSRWLVIVTADCDLAHRKFGRCLSCLPIITAQDYLETWADERCGRSLQKYAEAAANSIYRLDKKRDPRVAKMSAQAVLEWLAEDGAIGIAELLPQVDEHDFRSAQSALERLEYLADGAVEARMRLRRLWNDEGKTEVQQRGQLKDALAGMRDEYFPVPVLPGEGGFGYVVLLREMTPVEPEIIFASEADAKIAGASDGYSRTGRFSDFIRFGMAQQMGHLFSRIGMTSRFEIERDVSYELTISEFLEDT